MIKAEINKPSKKTYFMVRDTAGLQQKSFLHYGTIEVNQEMTSGLNNLETFEDVDLFVGFLLKEGISKKELQERGYIPEDNNGEENNGNLELR